MTLGQDVLKKYSTKAFYAKTKESNQSCHLTFAVVWSKDDLFIPLLVSYLPSAPKGYFVPTRCPSNHSWAVRACFCLEVVNFGPFGVFFGNRHDLRCGTNDLFQAKCSLNLLTSASPFKVFLHQQYVSSLKYLMSLRKQKRRDGQLCTPNGSSRNKTIADC